MKYVKLECSICGTEFEKLENDLPEVKSLRSCGKNHPNGYTWSGQYYCSRKCQYEGKITAVTVECGWCHEPVTRVLNQAKSSKSGLVFCNQSCACSYNNTQKRKSRRSKCEKMLFNLLCKEFPTLDIIPNDKEMFDGYECDIAIPSLSFGIEWNGVVHYKPIYGDEKLTAIKQIDKRKQEIAAEKKINLVVIPDLVSNEKYVLESFYNIKKIIKGLAC